MNGRGKIPIKNLLEFIGGFPMIAKEEWDETNWSWKGAILKLREFIGKRTNNIFKKPNDIQQNVRQKFTNYGFKYFLFGFKILKPMKTLRDLRKI